MWLPIIVLVELELLEVGVVVAVDCGASKKSSELAWELWDISTPTSSKYSSKYSLVTFNENIGYNEAMKRGRAQDKALLNLIADDEIYTHLNMTKEELKSILDKVIKEITPRHIYWSLFLSIEETFLNFKNQKNRENGINKNVSISWSQKRVQGFSYQSWSSTSKYKPSIISDVYIYRYQKIIEQTQNKIQHFLSTALANTNRLLGSRYFQRSKLCRP